jgi:hypothetical protein
MYHLTLTDGRLATAQSTGCARTLCPKVTVELIRRCVAAEVVAIPPSRKGKVRRAFHAMPKRPGSH